MALVLLACGRLVHIVQDIKIPGQNNFLSYSVPLLQEEFHLTYTQLGTTFSCATVGASFFQPLLGCLFDRYGARVCIPLSHATLALSLTYMSILQYRNQSLAYAQMVSVFFLLRALSMGALEIYPFACLQKWFGAKLGRALAVLGFSAAAGQALAAPLVSNLVEHHGWRSWAHVAAVLNTGLAVLSVLLLRRGPEVMGLGLDGAMLEQVALEDEPASEVDVEASCCENPCAASGNARGSEERGLAPTVSESATASQEDEPTSVILLQPKVLQLFIFGFFFGVIFAGVDFDMVGILEESSGSSGSEAATTVFMTLSSSQAVATPLLGLLSDSFSKNVTILYAILTVNCLMVTITLVMLTSSGSTFTHILYGILRATTHSVDQTILSSGLMFLAVGAKKEVIGRTLGTWQFAKLAGTGFGPWVYGFSRDHFGEFRIGLLASALPMLLMAMGFACRLITALPCSCRRVLVGGYVPASGSTPKSHIWQKRGPEAFAMQEDLSKQDSVHRNAGATEEQVVPEEGDGGSAAP
eukprot:CAMPEP_0178374578 /NCGR_PEP_ID=MMETSP0689_2-20121128/2448_1 /TAXON_ID=160604 /ORGANISM="Amphidinium massartii, Strain CS-259" /LENGTH=525 /DNA_ID=CAMNT_0019994551 /DNA_START=104 /DNA_END=1682 /DNA_ORIENTATION=-